MEKYSKLKDIIDSIYVDRKKGKTSNTIYTFDVETTSLYKINNKWTTFDYTKDLEFYKNIEKRGVLYLWQFSINENVYFGRELKEFKEVLLKISDLKICKIIYVFNLAFEFQWLLNILKGYNLKVLATSPHKVISFYIEELNIEFRCLYRLTNLSLDKASKTYNKSYKKLTNTIDYNVVRTPLTILDDDLIRYAEYDCLACYEIIKYYLKEYKNICQIPLTQTGELRREFKEKTGYYYFKNKVWKYIGDEYTRQILMTAFQGAYTHGNFLKIGKIINNVHSADIGSSYPFRLLTDKFPFSFFKIRKSEHDKYNNERYAHIYYCRLSVEVKGHLTYISSSKVINLKIINNEDCAKKLVYDNGKLFKGDNLKMVLTDIDLDIIESVYNIKDFEIIEEFVGLKRRLEKSVILYLLQLFKNKTVYKNIDNDLYMKSKNKYNAVYGSAVFNIAKQNTIFKNNEWSVEPITLESIKKALENSYGSYTALMPYSVGVYTTAYARKHIINAVQSIERDFIYSDTDSVKFTNFKKHYKKLHNINMFYLNQIDETCIDLDLKRNDFIAVNSEGDTSVLGMFDFFDGHYDRFITQGSKKYAYEIDGKIGLTVAGLPKINKLSGVKATINSLEDFNESLIFGYEYGKNTLMYIHNDDLQSIEIEDEQCNIYIDKTEYSIILMPTTYTLKKSYIDEFEISTYSY